MRIFIQARRGWLAAAATTAALGLAGPAMAQYSPYTGQQPYGPVATAPVATTPVAGHQGYVPYGTAMGQAPQHQQHQQQPPQYMTQGAYQGYQNYMAAQPTPYAPTTAGHAPQYNYAPPQGAPRVAMAQQNGGSTLPLGPPIETVPPGVPQNGGYAPVPQPEAEGYPTQGGGGYLPGSGYESYPGAGCNTCNVGGQGYGASAYGACDSGNCGYSTYGGMGAALSKHAGCGYWFGGVYGLLMERDNSNKYALAYVTDPSMPDAYPTMPTSTVLTTRNAAIGYQPGVEFRLGRAFGGGHDPCGCCCGPTWGFEAVYWTLFEDDGSAQFYNPTPTSRTYTMMPMYGLEYDHGSVDGYMPVNQYWDHGAPSMPANDIRVTQVRVRSSFEVQNLELNLLRLNLCGGGCGPGMGAGVGMGPGFGLGGGYGMGAGGGCDPCGGGCAPCRGPRYSCTAVCGFRWMQFDEDFMFGVNFNNPNWGPNPSGFLDYRAEVENNLFGAQIGCNGMYRIGCKWGLHLNTLVGLYGNDIDVRQYMNAPIDNVRYIGTGEDFDVRASKTDVAMIGELRIGASYQATCRCRVYGGWRAIGVTGIALATEQTPTAFMSAAQMANYVNSNGSLILHGLQTGVEWNY